MKIRKRLSGAGLLLAAALTIVSPLYAKPPQKITPAATTDQELVKKLPGFTSGFATVHGIKIHYVTGGTGKALVLLPGWPQTWWSYHKMMPLLAKKYHVIVIDIRGMGSSDKPESGYDKKTLAGDVNEVVHQLGYQKAYIAGHDIGAQVAFSVAANYPALTEKLVLIDVPHPDESFAAILMLPAVNTPTDKLDPAKPYLWWFAFNQLTGLPEELVSGHADILQKYVFHYLLKDEGAMTAFDRAVYANAYNSREAIRAGNGWYQAFPQDIADYKSYQKLTMPVLGIGGPGYNWLQYVLPGKTTDLKVVEAAGSGHFVPEEKPEAAVQFMEDFLQ